MSIQRFTLQAILNHWNSAKPNRVGHPRSRPQCESLESREVPALIPPAIITVTSTLDTVAVDGVVTFREAIESVNAGASVNIDVANTVTGVYGIADAIAFAISGTGVQSIELASTLPALTKSVSIDGYTQTGAKAGANPILLIELDGSLAGDKVSGLTISAADVAVRGLVINGFQGNGITILNGGTRATITGNFLGVNADGTKAIPNGHLDKASGKTFGSGVYISGGAANNIIGGSTPEARNILSGNFLEGVTIENVGTTGNVVSGNFIGTDVTGTKALTNGFNGISIIDGASKNIIGGEGAAFGNLISGNKDTDDTWGIWLGNAGTGNEIAFNRIGTDVTGKVALPNGVGLVIEGGTTNTLVRDNVISGNDGYYLDPADNGGGVIIAGAGTTGNVLIRNRIGTTADGQAALGNWVGLVIADGASFNKIGPSAIADANTISGNVLNGVVITGKATAGNLLGTNYIGTDPSGTFAIPNLKHGVVIEADTNGNQIGSLEFDAGNLISGNGQSGVVIFGNENTVAGNYIGLDDSGTKAIPNGEYGVEVLGNKNRVIGQYTTTGSRQVISGNTFAGIAVAGSGNSIYGNLIGTDRTGAFAVPNQKSGLLVSGTNNTIGGADALTANLISGNGGAGVLIQDAEETGGVTGNSVNGNFIGTNPDGSRAVPNGGDGVFLDRVNGNTVGARLPDRAANVISGNVGHGVRIVGGSGNTVLGNSIGTDKTASIAIPNGGDGVRLDGSSGNTIGGSPESSTNIISGNRGNGVSLVNGSNKNEVSNNYLGLALDQETPLPNSVGVFISGSSDNTIGGTVDNSANIIGGNTGAGVAVGASPTDVASTGNAVFGNIVSANGGIAIDLANNGPTPNGANPRAFPNAGQNFPVVTTAVTNGQRTVIRGSLTSVPSATYRVELYSGSTILGTVSVTTDASGVGTFSFTTTDAVVLQTGVPIVATATGTSGTSEFSPAVNTTSAAITIQPSNLPPGFVETFYVADLSASGGVGSPFTFTVTAGALPPGLTLSAAGNIRGATTTVGTYSFTVTATDSADFTGSQSYTIPVTDPEPPHPMPTPQQTATGATAGNPPVVEVFNLDGTLRATLEPFESTFTGGVHVVMADITGDGVSDIITGAAAGGGPRVVVYDGVTLAEIRNFFAFDAEFRGGVNLAAGDVNGDGFADIVTGAGAGDTPHVRVFSGQDNAELLSRFVFELSFTGGVNVAAGDWDGDGFADVITGAGIGGAPRVSAFRNDGSEMASFYAGDPESRDGVLVSFTMLPFGEHGDIVTQITPTGPKLAWSFNPITGIVSEDNTALLGVAVG